MMETRKLATASLALLAVAAVATAASLGVLAAAAFMPGPTPAPALQDASLGLLYRPNRPAADFTPTPAAAPALQDDQFRIVTDRACGDHVIDDDTIRVFVWFSAHHPSRGDPTHRNDQLRMFSTSVLTHGWTDDEHRWRGTVDEHPDTMSTPDDFSAHLKADMAAALRRWRQGSGFMTLDITPRMSVVGLLRILDVIRDAGFRCVYLGHSRSFSEEILRRSNELHRMK